MCEIIEEISGTKDENVPECDVLCFLGAAKIMVDGNQVDGSAVLAGVRQNLNAGSGDNLLRKYRDLATAATDPWEKHEAKYKYILVGAMVMTTGARISDHDIQHLRQLASEVQCNETFTYAFADTGFRGPGKRQFLVALEHYKPGTPRNFMDLSCHACGKTEVETGKALLKCSKCSNGPGWFCNKDCQRSLWRIHKRNCGKRYTAGGLRWLNV